MKAMALATVMLVLAAFAIFPLSLKPRFQDEPGLRLIASTLASFHKGLAAWGFYTNTNTQFTVSAHVFDPIAKVFQKLPPPLPLVASSFFLFRGQSTARFEAITHGIIRRAPQSAQWICSHFQLQRNRRIYYTMSPPSLSAAEKFLVSVPESQTRIDHQVLQTTAGKMHLLSFVCQDSR